ncbi:SRPBCC domain-containing protein [Dyadobacter sp. 676]|uniref:SRPBCC domain-containing protein n=1 Tax=Dyadobacter sp. 676 TaxID=3088362 RepID=A0AAU8FJ06_9BACT
MEAQTTIICPPDLTSRPLGVTVQKVIKLLPRKLFKAWTTEMDLWLAAPGSFLGRPEPNTPFYFETMHQGMRHPHYGRFLYLEEPGRIEMTWVTGQSGTDGAETVLTVELSPHEDGTFLRLTHAEFLHEAARKSHEDAWPAILEQLEERMSRPAD